MVEWQIGDQPGGDEPTGKCAQRDVRFDTGEGRTDAVVVAVAEAEVLVVLAIRTKRSALEN